MSRSSTNPKEDTLLIAQISDLHMGGPGEMAYGIAPVSQNLERTVAYINALDPRPQLTLVTGDILYTGAIPEAREAKRLLSALKMPWYIVPGNHDDRAVLRDTFPVKTRPTQDDEFIHYAFVASGLRFIGLDTSGPGVSGGVFCQQRADWLEAQLASDPHQPTVLFMHHPPVKFGILETDEDGFEGVERLGEIVGRYPAIKHLLCGHTHMALFAHWQGACVSTAPTVSGTCLALDLTMTKANAFHLDDPAFFLHKWTQGNELLSYLVNVREDDTLHLF